MFKPFGPDHAAVLVIASVGAVVVAACGRSAQGRDDQALRRISAVLLLANELAGWGYGLWQGVLRIPLQLCDITVLLMVFGLWTLQPAVCRIGYFWALAGSLIAVLTPDLSRGFPNYWFFKFFLTHGGVVLAAVYLASSGRVILKKGSVLQAWLLTNAYAAAAGLLNACCGTNYGYLAAKPTQPSLLDYMGPWPIYVLAMEGLAVVCFVMCTWPLRAKEKHA